MNVILWNQKSYFCDLSPALIFLVRQISDRSLQLCFFILKKIISKINYLHSNKTSPKSSFLGYLNLNYSSFWIMFFISSLSFMSFSKIWLLNSLTVIFDSIRINPSYVFPHNISSFELSLPSKFSMKNICCSSGINLTKFTYILYLQSPDAYPFSTLRRAPAPIPNC